MDEGTGTTHSQDYPVLTHSGIFGKLYLRHAAIASYQANNAYLQQLSTHKGCDFEAIPVASAEVWWNWDNQQHPVEMTQLWQKANQLEQESELTKLILEAKGIYAQKQQFPATLANLASTACPGETWQYKLNRDGTASIHGVGNAAIILEKPQN
ncbi:MAG: hypothetical protein ACLFT0_13350 [Spirulinaceae cyanobacterium]